MANDEEPVEKALMASSSVAVTSEDSGNSSLATFMASAESLPGEVREPLSGGASTPLSERASTPSGMRANDEEPVKKALTDSSSVAVTPEDSANSNLATLMAPAESLPGEVREPLSGGASTPLSERASAPSGVRANDVEPVERLSWLRRWSPLHPMTAPTVTSSPLWHQRNLCPVRCGNLCQGEHQRLLSGRASTPSGERASPESAPPSPASVPATARTGAAIRNNSIHRPNVVTRRAAAELAGAVTRYRGVRPDKNNNNDDNSINNNNHAALAECFQPSTLHKLRQPGLYTDTDTPDDNIINNKNLAALAECFQSNTLHKLRQPDLYTNTDTPNDNINNKNHAALAERFQPSTLHKLRQPGLYTNTDTSDDNNINNINHAALAERFQPSTLHKLRQLGRYTNTDTPDTGHQLDAEVVPAEVAYTRTNTQPTCSGGGELDRVPNIFKEGMIDVRHHTS